MITLVDCEITAKWDDRITLTSLGEQAPIGRLGRLEYPREQVLNHRIEEALRFHHRGDMVEGVILAMGSKPVPEAYCAVAPLELTFADQFESQISVSAEVFVDRSVKKAVGPQGTGLYGPSAARKSGIVGARVDSRIPGQQISVDMRGRSTPSWTEVVGSRRQE